MNARRRVRSAAWTLCAAALLCAAASAPAQTIYKQVDAAGRITYTDRPDAAPSPQTATDPAFDVASALAGSTAMSSRHAAIIDANEAARRLRQARLERAQGANRLPGEEARGADAGAANDRYRRRQDALWRAVELAQHRSSETSRALRAHR
jgi:hypothetical protein